MSQRWIKVLRIEYATPLGFPENNFVHSSLHARLLGSWVYDKDHSHEHHREGQNWLLYLAFLSGWSNAPFKSIQRNPVEHCRSRLQTRLMRQRLFRNTFKKYCWSWRDYNVYEYVCVCGWRERSSPFSQSQNLQSQRENLNISTLPFARNSVLNSQMNSVFNYLTGSLIECHSFFFFNVTPMRVYFCTKHTLAREWR